MECKPSQTPFMNSCMPYRNGFICDLSCVELEVTRKILSSTLHVFWKLSRHRRGPRSYGQILKTSWTQRTVGRNSVTWKTIRKSFTRDCIGMYITNSKRRAHPSGPQNRTLRLGHSSYARHQERNTPQGHLGDYEAHEPSGKPLQG
jgi:hypothetical protein